MMLEGRFFSFLKKKNSIQQFASCLKHDPVDSDSVDFWEIDGCILSLAFKQLKQLWPASQNFIFTIRGLKTRALFL